MTIVLRVYLRVCPSRAVLLPRRRLATSGTYSMVISRSEEEALRISCMETRGAAKHRSMLRTAPSAKNNGAQDVGHAKVVKACSGNRC